MNKKILVKILGILIIGISLIYIIPSLFNFRVLSENVKILSFSFVFHSIGLFVFFISGIGLLLFKNWARILSILIAIFFLFSSLFTILKPAKTSKQYTTTPDGGKTLIVTSNKPVGMYRFFFLGQIAVCLAIVSSFNRLKVKELFK